MITVDMRVYSEQATGDRPHCVTEIPGERHTCALLSDRGKVVGPCSPTDLIGENGIIIQQILRPIHQGIDIFWCR